MESWNDERLDELSRRMDAGFEKAATKEEMNRRFDETKEEMNRRFNETKEETNRRFDEGAAQLERFEAHLRTEFHRFTDRLDKLFYLQLAFVTSIAVGLLTHAI